MFLSPSLLLLIDEVVLRIKNLPVNARFWLSLARRRGCSALISAGQMVCSCAGISAERITPVFRVKHTKQIGVLTPVQGIQGHRSLRFFCLLHVFVSLFFPSSLLSSFFFPQFTHKPAPLLSISLFTARWVVFTVLGNLSGAAFCSSSVSSPFQKAISRRSMWITKCAGRGCSPNCAERNGCLSVAASDWQLWHQGTAQVLATEMPWTGSQQTREERSTWNSKWTLGSLRGLPWGK